jgi:hypothetical protein
VGRDEVTEVVPGDLATAPEVGGSVSGGVRPIGAAAALVGLVSIVPGLLQRCQ